MALSFSNGSSEYVNCGNDSSIQVGNNMSLSGWINPNVSGNSSILAKQQNTGSNWPSYGILVYPSGANKVFGFYLSSNGTTNGSKSYIINAVYGGWFHFVCTYDGSSMKVYINGSDVGSPTSYASGIGYNSDPLYLGRWRVGGDLYYNGSEADIRIYNKTLSDNECEILYYSRGNDNITGSLVARYILNEGADGSSASGASSIIDYSGNSNHGTPYNTPTYQEFALRLY